MKRKFDGIGDGESRNDYSGFEESNLDQDSGDEQMGSFDATESKAEKNRERNREHAKRTRQRKKEMIEGMKMRLLDLQREVCWYSIEVLCLNLHICSVFTGSKVRATCGREQHSEHSPRLECQT